MVQKPRVLVELGLAVFNTSSGKPVTETARSRSTAKPELCRPRDHEKQKADDWVELEEISRSDNDIS